MLTMVSGFWHLKTEVSVILQRKRFKWKVTLSDFYVIFIDISVYSVKCNLNRKKQHPLFVVAYGSDRFL